MSGQFIMISGVWPAWPGGGDMGSWKACLLVEILVEGTICILAFYYILCFIRYTLSGQIIMRSEIIIIWPLSVYIKVKQWECQNDWNYQNIWLLWCTLWWPTSLSPSWCPQPPAAPPLGRPSPDDSHQGWASRTPPVHEFMHCASSFLIKVHCISIFK